MIGVRVFWRFKNFFNPTSFKRTQRSMTFDLFLTNPSLLSCGMKKKVCISKFQLCGCASNRVQKTRAILLLQNLQFDFSLYFETKLRWAVLISDAQCCRLILRCRNKQIGLKVTSLFHTRRCWDFWCWFVCWKYHSHSALYQLEF